MSEDLTDTSSIDPITTEVLSNAVLSICEEMGIVLSSTARSPLLRESGDFACTLHDEAGALIAQTNTLPALASLARDAVPALLSHIGDHEPIEAGDVYFTNHMDVGGSHVSDVKAIAPIYLDDELFCWIANCAHWPDVGGAFSTGYVAGTEIFQEGVVISPVRFYRRGELDHEMVQLVLGNVRGPSERLGDLRAQVAAIRRGERRIGELVDKYGKDTVRAFFGRYLDYTETRVRKEIESLPNGTYEFVDSMDNNGIGDDPVRIQVAVTIEGDHVHCDFTGSDPQVAGPINGTPSVVLAGVNFALRGVTDPLIPINDGVYRPVTFHAPRGSWLNANPPAAHQHSTHETGNRVMDVVLGALSKAIPDKVPAAMHGTSSIMIVTGEHPEFPGESYVLYECVAGGFGGRPGLDGIDGIRTGMGNAKNIPVEVAEVEYPVVTEWYQLEQDSGGPGQYRGGMALERAFRIKSSETHTDGALCISVCERCVIPPYGLHGGEPGRPGRWRVQHGNGTEEVIRGKDHRLLAPGEVFRGRAPGGGGWGDPLARDPQAVLEDYVDERISPDQARDTYGVVIGTDNTVDANATEALRAELQQAKSPVTTNP
jgi:N-methylhydantoinase B